jgi:pimeloyl-ACP methyl ester carboxylesterase
MNPTGDVIRVPGPWRHRDVSANGARFHVAECGEGPLVLLLHGFPTFWWTWRDYLPQLAGAGYRAVAMDLRGFGGSDRPPRGYDAMTLSADVVGVIRALGAESATAIGHGWGGFLVWTTAVLHADAIRAGAVLSMPHPVRLREALLRDPAQARAASYSLGYQRPWLPERRLVAADAAVIGGYLHDWSATAWPPPNVEAVYRSAIQIDNTAHCAIEYYRWAIRSIPRADGRRFISRMRADIVAPVLQIHGGADPVQLPSTANGSGAYVAGKYRSELIAGAGHFVHEERADIVAPLLLDWLDEIERRG